MRLIFEEGERRIMKMRPPMSVTDWASKYLIVQDGPFKGAPLRMNFTPYLGGIMDAYSDPGIEQVVVCGSPQTGKTLAMYACMGYSIDRRTGTKMLTMPDDKNVSRISAEKLMPLMRGSPLLNSLMAKYVSGHIRLKDGTSVFLSSAQSPAQRASITVRDLYMDEEDLYQAVAGRGDPVMDFLERTRSYSFRRKIMRVSKPVGDGTSSIWRALTLGTDLLYSYEIPCRKCGAVQFFKEGNIEAEGLNLADVDQEGADEIQTRIISGGLGRYRCDHCGSLWDDTDRNIAVANGAWRPSKIESMADTGIPSFEAVRRTRKRVKTVGFHLPAILSKAVSLSEIAARKWLSRRAEDLNILQAQANGDWARPYIAAVLTPRELDILERVDPAMPRGVCPADTLAVTIGIDTQKNGFYYIVMAWLKDMTKYVVDYGQLYNFEEVTRLVWGTKWPELDKDGQPSFSVMHECWRAGIDSGGTKTENLYSRTEEVYEYVRAVGQPRLYAIKGTSKEQVTHVRMKIIDTMPGVKTKIIGGLNLYLLDTSKLKSEMFSALLNMENTKPIMIFGYDPGRDNQEGLHDEFVKQMTAERQVRTPSGKMMWVQEHRDNHFLDCGVIATACGHVTWGPSLQMVAFARRYQEENAAGEPGPSAARRQPRKSRFR